MPAKTEVFIQEIVTRYFAGQTFQLVLATALVGPKTTGLTVVEPPALAGYARAPYVVQVQPDLAITNASNVRFGAVTDSWQPVVALCLAAPSGDLFYWANLKAPLLYAVGDVPEFEATTLTFKEK